MTWRVPQWQLTVRIGGSSRHSPSRNRSPSRNGKGPTGKSSWSRDEFHEDAQSSSRGRLTTTRDTQPGLTVFVISVGGSRPSRKITGYIPGLYGAIMTSKDFEAAQRVHWLGLCFVLSWLFSRWLFVHVSTMTRRVEHDDANEVIDLYVQFVMVISPSSLVIFVSIV